MRNIISEKNKPFVWLQQWSLIAEYSNVCVVVTFMAHMSYMHVRTRTIENGCVHKWQWFKKKNLNISYIYNVLCTRRQVDRDESF